METIPVNSKQLKYESAIAHVKKIREFYNKLIIYVVVMTGLAIFNFKTAPYHLWFFYPLFFWGLGLAIRGAKLFAPQLFFGKEWEQRKIKEFMDRSN